VLASWNIDDEPRSVGLTLQCTQREVVPVKCSAADQALTFDPQVCRYQNHLRRQHPETGLGRTLGFAAVEVVVGEQAGEVVDDLLAPAFDRAEGVDPIGVIGIHRVQRLRVAFTEARQQRQKRLADRLLVLGRQVREVGHVRMLGAAVNFWSKYRVVAAVVKRKVCEMSPLLMVYFSVGTPFAGFGLVKLQARLERWDYDRHAED
jgi:hypothetical protein